MMEDPREKRQAGPTEVHAELNGASCKAVL